ncbi:hypothetical protein T484DRAFT_1884865, partial [Baffinella frigidus]
MLRYLHAVRLSIESHALALSSLSLTSIPPEVYILKNVTALTSINLFENSLDALPELLFEQMLTLQVLDASRNRLTSLPASLGNQLRLRLLILNDNQLPEIPKVVFSLSRLETLAVDYNQITAIPGEVMLLEHLDNFRYTGNNIAFPPREVQVQDLRVVYKFLRVLRDAPRNNVCELKSFGLTDFPSLWDFQESSWFHWMPTLNLKDNAITSAPGEIVKMSGLTQLYLDDNKFASLPINICFLSNLTDLQLNNNEITVLPYTVSEFQALTLLGLATNKFDRIPEELTHIRTLEQLVMDDNSIVEEMRFMDDNSINEVPETITRLANLKVFSLSLNRLTTLPMDMVALTALTELRFNRNLMKIVPACIITMSWLVTLKMAENEFEHITDEMMAENEFEHIIDEMATKSTQVMLRYRDMLDKARLSHRLDISSMALRRLPDEIGDLASLTELNLVNNLITELSKDIGDLASLTELNLVNNLITELPEFLGQLQDLLRIDCSHNRITHLPADLT